ncbi:hypothetical protein PENSPDRAFT_680580 [Peniophora sp. CONT]|nr:hypothetical protein PENSPDRAFT_680580 [Peniophora sp. CONT]
MSLRFNTVSSASSAYSLFPTGTASPNAFGLWGHDARETYEQVQGDEWEEFAPDQELVRAHALELPEATAVRISPPNEEAAAVSNTPPHPSPIRLSIMDTHIVIYPHPSHLRDRFLVQSKE